MTTTATGLEQNNSHNNKNNKKLERQREVRQGPHQQRQQRRRQLRRSKSNSFMDASPIFTLLLRYYLCLLLLLLPVVHASPSFNNNYPFIVAARKAATLYREEYLTSTFISPLLSSSKQPTTTTTRLSTSSSPFRPQTRWSAADGLGGSIVPNPAKRKKFNIIKSSYSSSAMGSLFSTSSAGSSDASSSAPTVQKLTKLTFRNKSILLTGASRGLGRSLAYQLSRCHPSLLILSGRDKEALEEVSRECQAIALASSSSCTNHANDYKLNVEIIICDLADASSVQNLGKMALQLAKQNANNNSNDRNGGIDILINNGGVSSRSNFLQTKLEIDERIMQINFFSGVALTKLLVPPMIEYCDGGKIIWISSVQGKLGTPHRTSYAASKFAVQGYSEALRSELASHHISVHVVSPGYIRTNLSMSAIMGDGNSYSKMDDTTANGADPNEVACTILDSISNNKTDFIVAATMSAKVALWLKFLFPSFLETMLVRRFEKQSKEAMKDKTE